MFPNYMEMKCRKVKRTELRKTHRWGGGRSEGGERTEADVRRGGEWAGICISGGRQK